MITKTVLALLILALTACAPALTPAVSDTDIQNTAIAIVQTNATLTQTAMPTATPTATVVVYQFTPTPGPPVFTPIMTPDAIQVARWREYEIALAKGVLYGYDPVLHDFALCEWDILGRAGLEVYVWAYCAIRWGGGSASLPAIIYLDADGSVRDVKVVHYGSSWDSIIPQLFPEEVRDEIALYSAPSYPFQARTEPMRIHLQYRELHPEEPPLIVLGKVPTATPAPPTPMPPIVAVLTPDAFQVANWQKYQTELAKAITCDSRHDCPDYERFACEWDILGRSGQDVYVWAFCAKTLENRNSYIYTNPVVIHLEADGWIRNIEVPAGSLWDGTPWNIEIRKLFPSDIQEKIFLYHLSKRFDEMTNHSAYRLTHPEEPPLIVLSAMPTATPTP